jgi:hypothetical protein
MYAVPYCWLNMKAHSTVGTGILNLLYFIAGYTSAGPGRIYDSTPKMDTGLDTRQG